MINFGENWLIYKDKIMKNLQDIIRESILDDNIGDNSVVQMFFESIMNAKNSKEFKNMVLSLRSYLDDEIGVDYTKAYKRIKQYRYGYYLSIHNPENKKECWIMVASGPSKTACIHFYNSVQKVFISKYNLSLLDLLHDDDCIYILNDKWNELRKMIINRK